MPDDLAQLALGNPRVLYDALFASASRTLQQVAAYPNLLGAARIGFLAVLHTWSQKLTHHPHLHCVVPGGGLSADGRWVHSKPNFFLPVRVLSKVYRAKFIAMLRAAFDGNRPADRIS
jgi:hypothetical protein